MAKIISITNTKGGTGKSTVTTLLACALSLEDKKRVLVLDCDNQNSIINLRNRELKEHDESIYFDIKAGQPQFVNDLLDVYRSQYDYIFLDLPRVTNEAQSPIVYSLIGRCEFVFIPIIPSSFSIDSTLAFLRAVKELEAFKIEQSISFNVYGFFNCKERNKNNKAVSSIMQSNGLEVMRNALPRLRIFETVSTIENPLSFSDGLLRFKPFYNEFKTLVQYD